MTRKELLEAIKAEKLRQFVLLSELSELTEDQDGKEN